MNNAGIYHYKNDAEREKTVASWDNTGLSIEEIKKEHTVTEEEKERIKQTDNYKQFSKEAIMKRVELVTSA